MAVVGSIQDGIYGDYSVLATKAVLDLIIILVMTCSAGAGCVFSAVPVAVFEGVMTALASLAEAGDDRGGPGQPFSGRLDPDFLRGPDLVWGRENTGGQSAAGAGICRGRRVSALQSVKRDQKIRNFRA